MGLTTVPFEPKTSGSPSGDPDSRALFNAHDGITGRDGGPYLDKEEARLAEERRAIVEGREPDYEDTPASAGIVLVSASQLLHGVGVNVPSQSGQSQTASEEAYVRSIAEKEELPLQVFSEIPADAYTSIDKVDTSTQAALSQDQDDTLGPKPGDETQATEQSPDESQEYEVNPDTGEPRDPNTMPETQTDIPETTQQPDTQTTTETQTTPDATQTPQPDSTTAPEGAAAQPSQETESPDPNRPTFQ